MKYALFLRGINVGGNKKISMTELKVFLETLGFKNIKTLLNSGNVVFETKETAEEDLIKKVESNFKSKFGFESKIIIRTFAEIEKIIGLNPFKKITIEKHTRLYITLLPENEKSKLKLPYTSPGKDFHILSKTKREAFSALTLLTSESVKAMAFIEHEFGKNVTTRNWNTIIKLATI